MLYYLHYMLMTSGLSGTSVLLGVYFKTYTDASQGEIGALLMTFPFVCLIIKPLFCSMADRRQAHRSFLIISLFVEMLGFLPFAIVPFFPAFYEQHPRLSWYVLIVSCHLGLAGLGVGWSLGDCLAVNYSQKTGTPFGRMRLMGTLSWGVYGFIIGQINEVPFLPKYLPAFLILHASLIFEIAMVILWDKSDFEMVDPLAGITGTNTPNALTRTQSHQSVGKETNEHQLAYEHIDSMPSSLGGTLRLQPKTANVFRNALAADELDLRLKGIESSRARDELDAQSINKPNSELKKKELEATGGLNLEAGVNQCTKDGCGSRKNPQLILLRMILVEDGRVIKYIILFTAFGLMMAPMNFMFLSMEELSRERGYNFSQLAGAVLISQALIETLAFFVAPWGLQYVSKATALSLGLIIMSLKWFFYSGWYYTSDISPYWAVLGEWSHGISYGIFCTIQADVALMFANSSRLFIPELRKLGFLSKEETISKERREAEEKSIKMALRATIQALFGGFMDGLGQGAGALLCGIVVEMYSYITLWTIFAVITVATILLHLLTELSRSRWSDTYKAREGTKAHEIMQLSRAYETESSARQAKGGNGKGAKSKPLGQSNNDKKIVEGQTAVGC